MVKVFIWQFRGKQTAWGHASMLVDHTYMSWWPEEPGQVPSKWHAQIYDSSPYRERSLIDDIQAEEQHADHIIELRGLEEVRIKDWWQSFGLHRDGVTYQGPLQSWHTLQRNCSSVVATGLKMGGGDKYASWTKSRSFVWTPSSVLSYAQSIRTGLSMTSNPHA